MPAVQSTAAQQQGSPDSFPKRTPHDSGAIQPKGTEELQGNLQAALARTMTRSIALYFSRPVRLFRPTKVSGWHSLRGLALQHGASLTPQYVLSLVRRQGLLVIPKHFVPPMVVNALLGTVLWTTYATTFSTLEPYLGHNPTITAAISGTIAGGMQALVAAPAENVRLVLEGGSAGHSWSHAWKEVFQGTFAPLSTSKHQKMQDIRQLRTWMKDVGEMAGRGWDGWGWGCAKDMCGFAAFFAIFEITRRIAVGSRIAAQNKLNLLFLEQDQASSLGQNIPRAIHGVTLVTGGVIAGLSYEVVCRPWDTARRAVQLSRVAKRSGEYSTAMSAIIQKARDDGILSFFQSPTLALHEGSSASSRRNRRIRSTLRTLARVGPWGIGFLVWETYGPGLDDL